MVDESVLAKNILRKVGGTDPWTALLGRTPLLQDFEAAGSSALVDSESRKFARPLPQREH